MENIVKKQAVLLIHGIGEQMPMDTLRKFVETMWTDDNDIRDGFSPATVWSKPDTVSQSFELRRLTTARNRRNIRTDFFEFYWAHLMAGTTFSHVFAWMRVLLIRYPWTVPTQLRGIYFLLLGGIVVSGLFALNALLPDSHKLITLPWWLSAAMSIAFLPLIGYVLKKILGDAARYLHPAPENIQRRHEIRTAGLTILCELHKRNYERIIVVGHSLGSVIGYDVLTHAWALFHDGYNAQSSPQYSALDELENHAAATSDDHEVSDAGTIQQAQRTYHEELRKNGNEWRVTNFVTLGSPLTHAQILMARNKQELAKKQKDREFPTCLPALERAGEKLHFSFHKDGKRVPHHAAVFSATRWTNLYFPSSWIVRGDVIGGPLASVFGKGIADIPLCTSDRWGLFSHTLYWRYTASERVPPHILSLRYALDLAYEN